ncbi:MAG: signal peptide peptidase SppA [Bdellovibrio sp.]|nr:signal peptide peptidase SppA [Bdellovibrio sp.]
MAESKKLSPLVWILILSGVFFLLFLAVSGAFFLTQSGEPSGRTKSGFFGGLGGGVGVIEINGVILDSKKTLEKLEKMEEDPDVKAVVLRLNSPGGAVAPSQEIYEAVKSFSKPIVTSMASVAASGAYYIAVGTNQIFANPGTLTGSIGVLMEFASLEKLYDWAKVKRYGIKAGKFKDMGSEFRELTEEERDLIQTTVDDIMIQFRKAVAQGRNLKDENLTSVADGRIFTGHQAHKLKLVDKLGTLSDAIREAARLGKISGKPRVIRHEKKKRSILDLFADDDEDGLSGVPASKVGVFNLAQMARLLAPGLGAENLLVKPALGPGFYLLWNP